MSYSQDIEWEAFHHLDTCLCCGHPFENGSYRHEDGTGPYCSQPCHDAAEGEDPAEQKKARLRDAVADFEAKR